MWWRYGSARAERTILLKYLLGKIKVIKFDVNNQCGWRMHRKKIYVLEDSIKSVIE
jgi:hypothetical protein